MVWHRKLPAIHSNTLNSWKPGKCQIIFFTIISCINWMRSSIFFFAERGKKRAWNTRMQYDELTDVLDYISVCPSQENVNTALPTLEKTFVLLYDRASTCTSINECRKDLFPRKGRLPEELPPTLDAFKLYVNRAVYQASYCWAQSLLKILINLVCDIPKYFNCFRSFLLRLVYEFDLHSCNFLLLKVTNFVENSLKSTFCLLLWNVFEVS